MTEALAPFSSTEVVLSREDKARLEDLWTHAQASATLRAYRADWEDWSRWCAFTGNTRLPAQPVAVSLYLLDVAARGRKIATIRRRVAALRWIHDVSHQPFSSGGEVAKTLAGLSRRLTGRVAKKRAIDLELLRKLVARLPDTRQGLRDKAILLVGFFGAFRRSEFVAVRLRDLAFKPGGLIVTIPRSKTDQEGAGQEVPIAERPEEPSFCPVAALRAWLAVRADMREDDWVFVRLDKDDRPVTCEHMNDKLVARLVHRLVAQEGLPPAEFGAHSLRAGFVTQALRDGASTIEIMDVTRHRDLNVLAGYRREEDLLATSAATKIGRKPVVRTAPGGSSFTLADVFPGDGDLQALADGVSAGDWTMRIIALASGDVSAALGAWRDTSGVPAGVDVRAFLHVAAGGVMGLLQSGCAVLVVHELANSRVGLFFERSRS